MIPLKHNPMMLPRVDDLFKLRSYAGDQDISNCDLTAMFDTATRNVTGAKDGLFFKNIYMPLKIATSSGMPELSTYVDIGLSLYELAEVYWSQYGRAFLDAPYYLCKDSTEQATDLLELGRRARSVLLRNKYKYLKLIESLGLDYNPLFNVDGVEIRQRLENEGTNDVKTDTTNNSGTKEYNATADSDNVKTTHKVATYDDVAKDEYSDETKGQESGSIQDGSVAFGEDSETHKFTVSWSPGQQGGTPVTNNSKYVRDSRNRFTGESSSNETKYTHNNAKNLIGTLGESDIYDGVKDYQTGEGSDSEYYVESEDTAFGYRLIGGDKMEVEKLIRQGNIGVTKTTELIEDQRELIKFSIIDEYFNDLNKMILVGNWG